MDTNSLLDTIDIELSTLRKNLYKCFKYEEVEQIMEEIHETIDKIEELQELILEVDDD